MWIMVYWTHYSCPSKYIDGDKSLVNSSTIQIILGEQQSTGSDGSNGTDKFGKHFTTENTFIR